VKDTVRTVRLLALCYHDVVPEGSAEESGFRGSDSATYKISIARFSDHLCELGARREKHRCCILLTFDDGGSGAFNAADALDRAGYRGYFFITTGLIGMPGFLSAAQIAELHLRGHVIGSHGTTHRGRMSRMPEEVLVREWSESVQILSSIIGEPILTASVPSGFYAPRVARAAAAAGIRQLFTQKPTTQPVQVFGCEVLGRFTVRCWTPASRVRALASGCLRPRLEDALSWRFREMAKTLGGSAYSDFRRAFFERHSSARLS
jgi:peptidoglycan/xylan/chitin deacetylase (PgdA/CDA1 family)